MEAFNVGQDFLSNWDRDDFMGLFLHDEFPFHRIDKFPAVHSDFLLTIIIEDVEDVDDFFLLKIPKS